MIRNLHDEKVTPKQFARELILVDLDILFGYWTERWEDTAEAMTEREHAEVTRQLETYRERIERMLL